MDNSLANLIPQPRAIETMEGTCPTPRRLQIRLNGLDCPEEAALLRLADVVLKQWLRPRQGGAVKVIISRCARRELAWMRRIPAALAREAYELSVVGKEIRLTAPDFAGLRLGIQTIRQLLEDAAETGRLHGCKIMDWPRLPNRGVHYDLAREMECRPAHLRTVIERLAYFKLNQLHLYFENKFAFPSCPEVAPPGSMTPEQARGLCEYAKLFGITVIPQMSTLGHMNGFLHGRFAELRERPLDDYNLCPTHPEARPWLAGMIADVAAAFRSPFIHLGYDESHSGVCERCRRHGTPSQVLADHLNWLNGEVRKHGARTMIYGDKFLSKQDFPLQDAANGGSPEAARAALARVDRNILITNWHYTAPYSGTTRALKKEGFEVYGVTDTGSYWHDSIPVMRAPHWIAETIERDIAEGATGICNCTWEHYRGQVFDNHWSFHALAAERCWTDRKHDYGAWGGRFAKRFWGTSIDRFTEIAGLAEATPVFRRSAFLDNEVLDVGVSAALTPLWPSWGQAVLDFPEVGEWIIRQTNAFRKQATRNAHVLRALDMPGEIIRYVGIRARQRLFLEKALAAGDRAAACSSARTIRAAALQIARRLADDYRLYGVAVVDRARIRRHIDSIEACLRLLSTLKAAELKGMSLPELAARAQEQFWNPEDRLPFRASPLLPRVRDVSHAMRPAKAVQFAPIALTGLDRLSDVRGIHGGRHGLMYLRASPLLPRSGKGHLLFGADGPVKVWVNGKAVGCEPKASNPIVPDQYSVPVSWKRGRNEVLFALDTHRGQAWGVVARVKWQ